MGEIGEKCKTRGVEKFIINCEISGFRRIINFHHDFDPLKLNGNYIYQPLGCWLFY